MPSALLLTIVGLRIALSGWPASAEGKDVCDIQAPDGLYRVHGLLRLPSSDTQCLSLMKALLVVRCDQETGRMQYGFKHLSSPPRGQSSPLWWPSEGRRKYKFFGVDDSGKNLVAMGDGLTTLIGEGGDSCPNTGWINTLDIYRSWFLGSMRTYVGHVSRNKGACGGADSYVCDYDVTLQAVGLSGSTLIGTQDMNSVPPPPLL